MTGEQFVKLCYEEKKTILAEYFNPNSSSVVGKKISAITEQGISKDDLYDLLNLVLKENYPAERDRRQEKDRRSHQAA